MSDRNPAERFRFSDRITLVTSHGNSVIVNNAPLANSAERTRQLDLEAEREKAYRQGWSECEARKNQEIANLQRQLKEERTRLPAELNAYLEELEAQFRAEVVDASFRIAEYILERELANPDDYRRMLDEALAGLTSTTRLTVAVTPAFAEAALRGEVKPRPGLELIGDPALKPGEVRVSCPQGIVDGTFAARLTVLRDRFEAQLSGGASAEEPAAAEGR